MLKLGVEDAISGRYIQEKINSLIRFAYQNPDHETPDGRNILDAIVEEAVDTGSWVLGDEQFCRALERDGYSLAEADGRVVLRAMMPPTASLAAATDDVHALLDELGMQTAKGHLDQAIENHASGNWAAANAQLRSCMEDLFNEIARRLAPAEAVARASSESLRQLLAHICPPFFAADLGEWSTDGKNFVNGLFKRLHGHGSHPGLSEESDCTFRLHLVLVATRHFLRRTRDRLTQS